MTRLALLVLAGCGHGFFDPLPKCDGGSAAIDVAPGPAVIYRQSAFQTTGAGQNNYIQVTMPLPVIADDVIVATLAWQANGGAQISFLTDSISNTYSVAAGPSLGPGGWSQQTFVAHTAAANAGGLLVEVSFTTPALLRLVATEYGNIDTQTPIDTAATVTGTSSSQVTAGPVTTTNAHDLLVAMGSSDYLFPGAFSGWNARTSNVDFIVQDLEVRDIGTYNPMAPLGTTGNWVTQLVALRGL